MGCEDIDEESAESHGVRDEDGLPALNGEAGEDQVRLPEDEVGCDGVVDGAHSQDAGKHEPACDVGELTGDFGRCEEGNPRVLASSDGPPRAHLGHGQGDGQGDDADANPAKYHDRGSAGFDPDDEDSAKGCPADD